MNKEHAYVPEGVGEASQHAVLRQQKQLGLVVLLFGSVNHSQERLIGVDVLKVPFLPVV